MEILESQTVEVGEGLRLRHLVGVAAALALIVSLAVWVSDVDAVERFFARFSTFNIARIEVQSDWPLNPASVQKWVEKYRGKSLIVLSANEVIANLQKRPWVETVALKKEFPNVLRLKIGPKRAVATSMIKGQLYFLDANGNAIDNYTIEIGRTLDLPQFANESEGSHWDVKEVLSEIENMTKLSEGRLKVSQTVLGVYPQFKTYFTKPAIEVIWNIENWREQMPLLQRLLSNPPSQIGQLQRINLVFPKKAVVSSSLSK